MEIVRSADFVKEAVDFISTAWTEAGGRPFRLSLCGGNTPNPVYRALAEQNLRWDNFQITFGDERCVPPEHEESNYRMACNCLLDRIPIPARNVMRMKGEIEPARAAAEYEAELRVQADGDVYIHDLVLLGMGEDGHTASLFPGTDALSEKERWVVANKVEEKGTSRLTFTYPLINAARKILFLVTGEKKREIVDLISSGQSKLPAALVKPEKGDLTWLLG